MSHTLSEKRLHHSYLLIVPSPLDESLWVPLKIWRHVSREQRNEPNHKEQQSAHRRPRHRLPPPPRQVIPKMLLLRPRRQLLFLLLLMKDFSSQIIHQHSTITPPGLASHAHLAPPFFIVLRTSRFSARKHALKVNYGRCDCIIRRGLIWKTLWAMVVVLVLCENERENRVIEGVSVGGDKGKWGTQ